MFFPRKWGSGKQKKDFQAVVWILDSVAVSQPFSTQKKLVEGCLYVPNPVVFSWNLPVPFRVKCPCPFTLGEGITSSVLGEPNLSGKAAPDCLHAAGDGADEKDPPPALRITPNFPALWSSVLLLPAGLCYRAVQIENMLAGKAAVNTRPYAECQLLPLSLWFWYLEATGAELEPYKIHLPRCHKMWEEIWSFPSAQLWYPVFVMHLSKSCWCGMEDLMESFFLRNFWLDSRLTGCHQHYIKLSAFLIFSYT